MQIMLLKCIWRTAPGVFWRYSQYLVTMLDIHRIFSFFAPISEDINNIFLFNIWSNTYFFIFFFYFFCNLRKKLFFLMQVARVNLLSWRTSSFTSVFVCLALRMTAPSPSYLPMENLNSCLTDWTPMWVLWVLQLAQLGLILSLHLPLQCFVLSTRWRRCLWLF